MSHELRIEGEPRDGAERRPLLVWVGIDVAWAASLAKIAEENDWRFARVPSLAPLLGDNSPLLLSNVDCLAAMLDGDRGGETIDQMQRLASFPPTVFVAFGAEPKRIVEAVQAGAVAVIEAVSYAGEIRAALVEAMRRAEANSKQRELRRGIAAAIAGLRSQEATVLRGLIQERSPSEIAAELGVARRTVELLRANIFRRLRVRSSVELCKLFAAAGIDGRRWDEKPWD